MKKQDIVKKFFTEEGYNAHLQRFKSFVNLFNEGKIPISAKMLGFGDFEILSNEECLNRLTELGELLGIGWKIKTIKTKLKDGSTKNKRQIVWQ